MSKNNKDVKRGIVLYIDGKEVKRDVTDIKAEIRKLTKELDRMTIGSKEYNAQMAKIRHLNSIVRDHKGRLREVNEELGKSHFNAGKLVDGFNRFGGVVLAAIGFLTGFALALRSIREERNKLESSQAGLKALTGLDDSSIAWLTEQAKTLSTTMTEEGLRVRQSAAEILDAFMLVGSAKPELLGDKEALKQVTEEAMRLQAAAKDITLNEAVDALTLSLNQYGAQADQAARYANVLAAGSKEGAANIASQAKAIRTAGTAAASANISIEQTVGLVETLAYRGIKDEVAGTGLKRFFLKLQTGVDETNPKIVGLDKALENLKNKNMDAGGIKKMFGEEGFNAASVILQNTDMVNNFTKAVTGTNVAYEQAAINSATAAAKLDQARNKMKLAAIELGEKLNPVLTVSTNMMTNVVKILPGLIDWFQKWGSTIVALLVPVAAYIGYLKLAAIYHATLNTITKVAATLKVLYAVATANVAGNLTGANKILTLFSLNMVKNATVLKIATAATYLFAAAKAVLTGNLKAARVAMAAFNVVCTKNVYIAVAVAVLALATAIYKLATRTTEAEEAALDYQKRVYAERTELRKLTEAAQKAGDGTQRRKELIDEINSKYGGYLTNLLNEHSSLQDIKRAYNEINQAMQRNIAQKVLDEKTEKISREMLDSKISQMDDVRNILSHSFLPDIQVNEITQKIDQVSQKYAAAGKSAEYIAKSLNYGIKKLYFQDGFVPRDLEGQIEDYVKVVLKEYKKVQEVQKALAAFVPSVGQTNELPEVVITGTAPKKKVDGSDGNVDDKKKEKDKFVKVEEDYYHRISAIKKKYLNDDLMTQEQYSEQMQQAEMQLLNDKMAIAVLEPELRKEIADKVLDIQIKMREKVRGLAKKDQEDAKKTRDKTSEETFSHLDKEYQLKLEDTAMYHYKNRTSEDEYNKEMRRLQNDYYSSILDNSNVSEEKKQEIRKQSRDMQLEDAKNDYEKEIDEFNTMTNSVVDAAQLLQDSMADFFTSEEKDFGKFMGSILTILLDSIEKELIATQAAAIALITMKEITSKGWLGIATAAAKIVLIVAAFEGAKAILGNFYTGGYTGSGEWDQPQGIVHSNEFVANRYAVANPAVRPVLDLIDGAQRTGSIANLTAQDIASVVGGSSATKATPAAQIVQVGSGHSDVEMARTMQELNSVITKLVGRLNDPFYTLNVISGRSGLKNKLDEYETLLNNKSRKS